MRRKEEEQKEVENDVVEVHWNGVLDEGDPCENEEENHM